MKLYTIPRGQMWVVRVVMIVLVLSLWAVAEEEGAGYFILSIILLGFYAFYEVGWQTHNKKLASTNTSESKEELSDEGKKYINRWSWGATFFGFWWALFSKIPVYSLLYLIPIANLFFIFYFGKKGRRLSWEKGKWKSFNDFKRRQKVLDRIGIFVIGIGVVGILSTLLLLQLGTAREKARDAKRIADVNQIRTAVELYFDDNNSVYPNTLSDLTKYFLDGIIPKDPLTEKGYGYEILSGVTRYYVNEGVNVRSCAGTYCSVIAKTNAGYLDDIKLYILDRDWYQWKFHFTETPYTSETGYISRTQ